MIVTVECRTVGVTTSIMEAIQEYYKYVIDLSIISHTESSRGANKKSIGCKCTVQDGESSSSMLL